MTHSSSRCIRTGGVLLLLGLVLAATACRQGTAASETTGEAPPTVRADRVIVARVIPRLSELTEDEIFAGVPADVVAAIQDGDPVNGQKISELQGCAGCHSLQEGEFRSGPSWYDMANTAVGRVEGESPALYLYRSIMQPNAFIVRRFDADEMPRDFSEKLSTAEIGDLLALLLAQIEE